MKAPLAPIRVYQYTKDPKTDEYIVPLTKREQFAMAAMQGAWWDLTDRNRSQHIEHAAESCVKMADALIKELDK